MARMGYAPVKVAMDGKDYQVQIDGAVYEMGSKGMRRIKDKVTIAKITNLVVEEARRREQRRQIFNY